jgi:hypothetical protein
MRCYFPPEEVEERSKYLNFPIWVDQSRFEGASTAQLRTHYASYRASAAPSRELGLPNLLGKERQQFFWKSYGRYEWFLVADAAAINSIVGAPEKPSLGRKGTMSWINVVEVDWPLKEDEDDPEDADEVHEKVEGMDAYNVGFHRAAVETLCIGNPSITSWNMIGMHVLQALYGSLNEPDFQPWISVNQKSPSVINAGFLFNLAAIRACNIINSFDAIADLSSNRYGSHKRSSLTRLLRRPCNPNYCYLRSSQR